ncbi:pyridine nucleotide-disulfide oxidoreductase [Anaeromicrobium sediminis]|uniref:Pyridine nucleotide-disulfide oxidoreductase n=1 Tax=Anaeromicrobium sediminis TaxID=1478221 RepID=A0A267MPX6_9FIRM|nr:pyridine nucleotide-disulfide oxidoreductase [Anaeromicrobium sediminis]
MKYDVVVVGGGPAGLGAALSAKENGISSILIIERDRELGGILGQCIHNGFGIHIFKEELTGPEYAHKYVKKIEDKNIEYVLDTMVLDISKDKVLKVTNSKDGIFSIRAKAIILAMGCRERTRENIQIPGYRPSGILTAGAAQRYINMEGYMVGNKVAILGSGDIGLIMARRITLEGGEVIGVFEIMPYSSGLNRNIAQCLDDYNIPLYFNHTVVDIKGKNRVNSVLIGEVDENKQLIKGTEKEYECDTLLLSVGLIPENELSKKMGIEIGKTGGPVVNEKLETSVEGVFACGNVVHVHDVVDFVTEESIRAGKGAAEYLNKNKRMKKLNIKTIPKDGISYIVPEKIDSIDEDIILSMRVKDKYKNKKIVVKSNNKVIKEIKRLHMTPGEMERVTIKRGLIGENISEISVKIEGENHE